MPGLDFRSVGQNFRLVREGFTSSGRNTFLTSRGWVRGSTLEVSSLFNCST